jgi:hypothetical protein
MAGRVITVILTYDDPECGNAAEALRQQLLREAAENPALNGATFAVNPLPIAGGEGAAATHRDAVQHQLQQRFSLDHAAVAVVALMKGGNAEDFRRTRDVCQQARPPVGAHFVLTHLGNYSDVGLMLRNVVRRVAGLAEPQQAAAPPSAAGDAQPL